jgi:hypothetical protein
MAGNISPRARGEVVSAVAERYRAAGQLEKRRILDDLRLVSLLHLLTPASGQMLLRKSQIARGQVSCCKNNSIYDGLTHVTEVASEFIFRR